MVHNTIILYIYCRIHVKKKYRKNIHIWDLREKSPKLYNIIQRTKRNSDDIEQTLPVKTYVHILYIV